MIHLYNSVLIPRMTTGWRLFCRLRMRKLRVVQLVFVISHGRITHDLLRALLPYPQKFAQWFVLG